jgi:hypothetical protein
LPQGDHKKSRKFEQMDLTVYKILLIIIAAIAVGSVILALELTHDSLFLTLWDIFLNMAL